MRLFLFAAMCISTFVAANMLYQSRKWTTGNGIPSSMESAISIYNNLPVENTYYFDIGKTVTAYGGPGGNQGINNNMYGGSFRDIAYKLTAVLFVTKAKYYNIRWGVDGGYGGGMSMDGVTVAQTWNRDMWYSFNFADSNAAQFHQGTVYLTANQPHAWLCMAFEGCCDGAQQLMIKTQAGVWTYLVATILDGDNTITTTYPYPIVVAATPSSGDSHAQPSITILGSYFGNTQGTGSVKFYRSSSSSVSVGTCTVTAWRDNSITCTAPVLEGVDLAIRVKSGSDKDSIDLYSPKYRVNPPTISSVTPSCSRTDGTSIFAIQGTNFGINPTITSGSTTLNISSSTSILLKTTSGVPGAGTTGQLILTVGGQVTSTSFVYCAPTITAALTPNNQLTGNSNNVTITGNNFHSSSTTLQVGIYSGTCTGSTDRQICQLNANLAGLNNPVTLTVGGQVYSNSLWTVSYADPTITSLIYNNVENACNWTCYADRYYDLKAAYGNNSAGLQSHYNIYGRNERRMCTCSVTTFPTTSAKLLTIQGSSFGTTSSSIAVTIGTRGRCTNITIVTPHSSITCTPSDDVGTGQPLYVTVGTQISNNFYTARTPPTISGVITAQGGSTEGNWPITIDGSNFGTDKNLVSVLTTNLGSAKNCPVLAVTNIRITCTFAAGSDAVSFAVAVDTQSVTSPGSYYVYAAPYIQSVTPSTGLSTAGGSIVTVRGSNFGITGTAQLKFTDNSIAYCRLSGVWDHKIFACVLPVGTSNTTQFSVQVGTNLSNSVTLQFASGSIDKLEPFVGGSAGSTSVAIYGTNFGPTTGTVTIGGFSCNISKWLDTLIQVRTNPGGGTDLEVRVVGTIGTANSTSSTNTRWSYTAPIITSLSPFSGPTDGLNGTQSYLVTATGTNFDSNTQIKFGTSTTWSAPGNATWPNFTQLVFTLPVGQGVNNAVGVRASFQMGTSDVLWTYANPVVNSVTGCAMTVGNGTKDCSISGTDIITINGVNFGTSTANVSVSLRLTDLSNSTSVNCTVKTWSHRNITCLLMPNLYGGVGLGVSMVVTVNTLTSIPVNLVSWSGPSFSGDEIFTNKAPGDNVTLTVSSFCNNTTPKNPLTVKFGLATDGYSAKTFNCATVVMDCVTNKLLCTLPVGLGANHVFQAIVGFQTTGNSRARLSYNAPVVVTGTLRSPTSPDPTAFTTVENFRMPSIQAFVKFNVDNIYLKTLDGDQFLQNIQIKYVGQKTSNSHSCTRITTGINGTSTWVQCYTSSSLEDSNENFNFIVTAMGTSVSLKGADNLLHFTPPEVHNVTADNAATGCTQNGTKLSECPTLGTTRVTVIGDAFTKADLKYVTVGGKLCNIISYNSTRIIIDLPPGSGIDLDVVVSTNASFSIPKSLISYKRANNLRLTVGWSSGRVTAPGTSQSSVVATTLAACVNACESDTLCTYIEYNDGTCKLFQGGTQTRGSPVVSGQYWFDRASSLLVDSCNVDKNKTNSIRNCPRAGNVAINIVGDNFGSLAPLILLCALQCKDVTILAPHQMITCVIPEGVALTNQVILVQREGGQLSQGPNVAFQECTPGTYGFVNGTTTCQNCDSGKYSSALGVLSCDKCARGQFSGPGQSVCAKCDIGRYADVEGSQQCKDCNSGTYAATIGAELCTPCERGKSQNNNQSSDCTPCGPGEYQDQTNQTTCLPCEKGYFFANSGAAACSVCPLGTFSNTSAARICLSCPSGTKSTGSGLSSCENCSPGKHQPLAEQSSCPDCPNGRYADKNSTVQCTPCGPGNFSAGGAATCVRCPKGSYTDDREAVTCKPCGQGKYANDTGMSVCSDCEKGTANGITGQETCADCLAGTYSAERGLIACVACEPGQYSANGKAQFCTPCQPGFVQPKTGQNSCDGCETGAYNNEYGQTVCTLCAAGTYANVKNSTQCNFCEEGTAQADQGQTKCNNCTAGTYQNVKGQELCEACIKGFEQPLKGQISCQSCAKGKFATATGTPQCANCDEGFFAAAEGSSACDGCQAGSFSTYNTPDVPNPIVACLPCDRGTYQSQEKAVNCPPCPLGYFNNYTGQANCVASPPGYYVPISANQTVGSYECVQAAPGNYTDVYASTYQTQCLAGSFQKLPGKSSCDLCPPGSFSNVNGSSICTSCSPGTFQQFFNSTECDVCLAGSFQEKSGGSTCNLCPPGSFSNVSGSPNCTSCSPGTVQKSYNSTTCDTCMPGSYQKETGRSICDFCESGKFSNVKGSVNCTQCSPGKYQQFSNAAKCDDCLAGQDSALGAKECRQCNSQSVAPVPGTPECLTCPSGAAANQIRTACMCKVNFFGVNKSEEEGVAIVCKECQKGADCAIPGTMFETMYALPGFFEKTVAPFEKEFQPCIRVSDCPGGQRRLTAEGIEQQHAPCADNRIGDLCAVCEAGTTASTGGTCTTCKAETSTVWTVMVIIAVLVALVVIYGITLYNGNKLIKAAMIESDLIKKMGSGYAVDAYHEELDNVHRHGNVLTIFGSPAPRANFVYKLKIALGFFQILTSIMGSLQVDLPTQYKQFLELFNIFNFDILAGASIGCVVTYNYYLKFWFWAASPFVALLGLYLCVLIPQYCFKQGSDAEGHSQRKAARQRYWMLVMFTLFLIYPMSSSGVLRLYQCNEYYGTNYLRADFNIHCDVDGEWGQNMKAGIPAAIIISLGIPLFIFYMLRRYQKFNRLNELGVRAELGFLYDAYERQCWWWELVDMAHKLTLVALVAFVPALDYQVPTAGLVAVVYFIAILLLKPYLRKADDRIAQFAQCELILALMGSYWWANADYATTVEYDGWFSFVLISITFVFVALFALGFAYSFKKVFDGTVHGARFNNWVVEKLKGTKGCSGYMAKRELKKKSARRGDGKVKGTGEEFFDGIINFERKARKGPTASVATFGDDNIENFARNPLSGSTTGPSNESDENAAKVVYALNAKSTGLLDKEEQNINF